MENDLVAIRTTDEYKKLLDKSWDYIAKIKVKGYELAVIRWRWGVELFNVDAKYGDSYIDTLSEDIGWHRSTLFRTRGI
jgi:hypothetical protein